MDPTQATRSDSQRGVLVLVLGILGLVLCPVFAPVAVVLGKSDLDRMARGELDRSGYGLTVGGIVLGLVELALIAITFATLALIAFVAIVAAVIAQLA